MNIIGMLRRVIPSQYKDTFVSLATRLTPVKARAGYTNIYHCCVYRTGSQWIRRIFSDPRVYCWSGLKPINGASLGGNAMNRIPVIDRAKPEGFPPKTAVTGMFISYNNFQKMKKPENYSAFFVIRDPRELVVSWYLSTRYTHVKNPGVESLRKHMAGMTDKEGVMFSIEHWRSTYLFNLLLEWKQAENIDKRIKIFSFEDLTGDNSFFVLKKVFSHCRIAIPDNKLESVYESHLPQNIVSDKKFNKYSFALRKNNLKWPDYFDNEVKDHFINNAPTLVEDLGYHW
ncbi:MAG TPA: hypothetical protein ENG35_07990 [Desulfobacteraceae bacterium]|nr:hypothetical protein [Desulfobacteraceae bacterium]